jgi:hypothetical protein
MPQQVTHSSLQLEETYSRGTYRFPLSHLCFDRDLHATSLLQKEAGLTLLDVSKELDRQYQEWDNMLDGPDGDLLFQERTRFETVLSKT